MKILAIALLAAVCGASAAACDKVDAARLQLVMSEMGTDWSEQSDRVTLRWGWEWDGAPPARRLELLRAFAEGDRCLAGRSREILYYRRGQLVGSASPESGVQLVGATATVQADGRSGAAGLDLVGCTH